MVSSVDRRSPFERLVGRWIPANAILDFGRSRLIRQTQEVMDSVELTDDAVYETPFLRRLKRRYDWGRKNPLHRFADGHAQRRYDRAWHELGFLLKQNQGYLEDVGVFS